MKNFVFLNAVRTAKNMSTLIGLINELIQTKQGINSFSYFISHIPQSKNHLPHVVSHYPQEWIDIYKQKNYVKIDPIVQECLTTTLPFAWNYDLYRPRLNEMQAQLFQDSANCGIDQGITCPLRGTKGEIGGLCFAIEDIHKFMNNQYGINEYDLLALSYVYHESYTRIVTEKKIRNQHLSNREAECLLWSARGKTAHEIAIILNLSEETIKTYLKSCIQKLNVSNKSHAIAKAVMQHDITPEEVV